MDKPSYKFSQSDVFNREFYRNKRGGGASIQSRILDSFLLPNIGEVEASLMDRHPGFNDFKYEESDLYENSQPWIGLHPSVLQTPYSVFLSLFEFLESKTALVKVVDIGAAYGRAGFVCASVFPEAEFVGYEIVEERAAEANRMYDKFGLKKSRVFHYNVLEREIDEADLYLIYDFSNESDIHAALEKLAIKSESQDEFWLAAIGESTPSLVDVYFSEYFPQVLEIPDSGWKLFSP